MSFFTAIILLIVAIDHFVLALKNKDEMNSWNMAMFAIVLFMLVMISHQIKTIGG